MNASPDAPVQRSRRFAVSRPDGARRTDRFAATKQAQRRQDRTSMQNSSGQSQTRARTSVGSIRCESASFAHSSSEYARPQVPHEEGALERDGICPRVGTAATPSARRTNDLRRASGDGLARAPRASAKPARVRAAATCSGSTSSNACPCRAGALRARRLSGCAGSSRSSSTRSMRPPPLHHPGQLP